MTVEENLRAELLEEDGVHQYYVMDGQKVEFIPFDYLSAIIKTK